jgi:S1-C subfamily serine protease
MLRRLLLLAAAVASPAFVSVDALENEALRATAPAVVSFEGGTGFVASADGLVVTADHVATMVGERPWVRLGWTDSPGPFPTQLELVARAPEADLALYRLPEGDWPHLPLRAAPAREGEAIAVIAHPPRRPMLASFGRVLEAPTRWAGQPILEYGAPAYDGYSGGPVMDRGGRVLGVHRGWDHRALGHGDLVAVPAQAVLEAFPQLSEPGYRRAHDGQ